MLYDAVLGCSMFAALFHLVTTQSDDSQSSSDETIIIIIAVTASIVVIAVIVVILVGCVCFKKKVKVIRMTAMKRIINSTTKHMVRVGKLKTMDEHYREVDNEEIKLFPVISVVPEEKKEETDDNVEELNEPIAVDDIYGDNDQDTSNVENAADEDTPKIVEEEDEKPLAVHSDETEKEEPEKDDDTPKEDEKPDKTIDEKHFIQKKPPSFLNYIIKKNWKRPLVPNIAKSRRFTSNNKVVKRKRRAPNLNKTITISRKKPRKKLKKLRTSNYRYDYFMKPMKTKVKTFKWNKDKTAKKRVEKQGPSDPNTSKNIVLTIHEEESIV